MQQQTYRPSLYELQRWMRWILTDPRGVNEALSGDPHGKHVPEMNCLPFLQPHSSAAVIERLDVYAEGYFSRIVESMSADFKAILKFTGEDCFRKLVADYLKDYPSRYTNIGEVGEHFPLFLKNYSELDEAPILADLAQFEWLVIESFYSEQISPISPEALSAVLPESWPQMTFKLHPSLRLFKSDWPLDEWWSEDEIEEVSPQERAILVHYLGGTVRAQEISKLEFEVLLLMKEGKRLQEICEWLESVENNPDFIKDCFSKWIALGLICGINDWSEE